MNELREHHRALILQRRCAHCAESVSVGVVLRGRPCPHCGERSTWQKEQDLQEVLGRVLTQWRGRRWWAYGILAAGTLATGWFPIISTLLSFAFLIYARYAILRAPMEWFGPARRFTTKFTLRFWLVTVGLLTLIGNELLTFVPLASAPLKVVVALVTGAAFVEISLLYLKGRLVREASQDPSLRWFEWILPAGLLCVVAAVGGASALVIGLLWGLLS